ncbi:hypothetical protein Tco_1436374 [Tanacetum coccineum]
MVWRSTSLMYETGEKKVNEVNFISQGVEFVSRILATMTKTGVKFNLSMKRRMNWLWWTLGGNGGELFWEVGDDFGVDVLRFHTCLIDTLGFLEKFGWWFEQDIDGENEDDNEKKLVMVNEEGWMS